MTQVLNAPATSTLIHAEETEGERNSIFSVAILNDESGNVLVDQLGNELTASGFTPVIVLHAESTSTLLHAEDSQ